MILTEKVALDKECPFGVADSCVSRKCMAWREEKLPASKQTGAFPPVGTIVRKGDSMVMAPTGRGWCGLAGRP